MRANTPHTVHFTIQENDWSTHNKKGIRRWGSQWVVGWGIAIDMLQVVIIILIITVRLGELVVVADTPNTGSQVGCGFVGLVINIVSPEKIQSYILFIPQLIYYTIKYNFIICQ